MAEIGTATVKITPVIDEDALAQVDAAVREAVADALRKVADSLVATPNEVEPEPRFYAVHALEGWAVADREVPEEWAFWSEDASTESDVKRVAADLNEDPSNRDYWTWTTYGRGDSV